MAYLVDNRSASERLWKALLRSFGGNAMQLLVQNCGGGHCGASLLYASQDSDERHAPESFASESRSQSIYAVIVLRTVGIMGIWKLAQPQG
jgi:hypothetical protein